METEIYIDIETGPLPAEQREAWRPDIDKFALNCDKRWKPETVQANYEKKLGEWERGEGAALSAATGRVLLICYAVNNGDVATLSNEDMDNSGEADVLFRIADVVGSYPGCLLIGHNVAGFDLPFLTRRAWVRRTPEVPWSPRYSTGMMDDGRVRDTMKIWQQGDRQAMISLDRLASTFGVHREAPEDPMMGAVTGARFAEFWEAGKRDLCADYCENDVLMARDCYGRMSK